MKSMNFDAGIFKFEFFIDFFSSQTRIGKQRCNLEPLIGAPYGTYFEARAGKLYKLDKKPELSLSLAIPGTHVALL